MMKSTPLPATASAAPDLGVRPFRILLVEDDSDLRESVRTALEMRGYEVDQAGNGWVGVEMAYRTHYDLVITDVRMPVMDGLALARSLRRRSHAPQVMVLTAFPDWSVMQDAKDAGVSEVVVKPVDLAHLADRVAEYASAPVPDRDRT